MSLPMVKWEYITAWIKWYDHEQLTRELNEYGSAGYELVNFTYMDGKECAFIFKRPTV